LTKLLYFKTHCNFFGAICSAAVRGFVNLIKAGSVFAAGKRSIAMQKLRSAQQFAQTGAVHFFNQKNLTQLRSSEDKCNVNPAGVLRRGEGMLRG
jgi:hypothetical protein